MQDLIVPILTVIAPFLAGWLGACVPHLVQVISNWRNDYRLDYKQVADNLQAIITDLRKQNAETLEKHNECIKLSTEQAKKIAVQERQIEDQTQQIKILWYNVKKMRRELEDVKKKDESNYTVAQVLPEPSKENS